MIKQIPAIDVLRGLAAFGVVWFHSRVDLWVGFRSIRANPEVYSGFDQAVSWLSLPVSQLGSCVMLFFVLSGFCIHLPLAGKKRNVEILSYAVRRGFRIYPAYIAVLLFCFGAAWLMSGTATLDIDRYLSSGVLLQNWMFSGGQVAMNPSLWSIPVECELYLIYPILLGIHLKFGLRGSLIFTIVCTSLGWLLYFAGHGNAMGSFFKYAIIWNSGAWLAEQYAREKLPHWTGWHMIVLIITLFVTMLAGLAGIESFYLQYGWAIASLLLLWWLITDGSRFLPENTRWVRALSGFGVISYSLYLIHFPLFRIAGAAWVEAFGTKPANFLIPSIASLLAIPFAWAFYRVFELPSHEIGRKIGRSLSRRQTKRQTSAPFVTREH